jgi:hypothetical protein
VKFLFDNFAPFPLPEILRGQSKYRGASGQPLFPGPESGSAGSMQSQDSQEHAAKEDMEFKPNLYSGDVLSDMSNW